MPAVTTRRSYLPALAVAVTLPAAFSQLWPNRFPTPGYAVYALMTLVLIALSVALWVRAPSDVVSDSRLKVLLILVFVTWVWAATILVLKDEGDWRFGLIALLILVMVYAKQPRYVDVRRAMAWVAVIEAASVWFNWTLSQFGLQPSDWLSHDNLLCRPAHRAALIPFTGGEDWGGPFGHGNILGEVGAYIVFFALPQRGLLRVALVASGAYFVAISRSETALLGFLAGLAVIVLFWIYRTRSRAVSDVAIMAFAGVGSALAVAYVIVNPTLSERTYGWPGLLSLWRDSPIVGVPQALIAQLVEEEELPVWAAVHAHNMWIDTLLRSGIVGALLVLSVVLIAATVMVKAGKVGFAVGAGLLCAMLVFGFAEKVFSWGDGLGVLFLLLLGILGSSAWVRETTQERATP